MIAVVSAMPEEIAPLLARARARRALAAPSPSGSSLTLVAAELAGRPVALAVTGDGERNARLGARALSATMSLQRLIVVGVAGAATADLPSGALIVAHEVVEEGGADGRRGWHADRASLEAALRAGARSARVVSARSIADTAAAKRELAAWAGGAGSSLAVDLESATYVSAAVDAGVPWTVLRVISDAAFEELPALLNRARDDGGAIRRMAVVRGVVARGIRGDWSALPVLLHMRARVKAAAVALADCVERLLRAV